MRVLFVGQSWSGSSARSLREALQRRSDITLGEICEDLFLPRHHALVLRLANRVLRHWQIAELEDAVRQKLATLEPEVLVVYKGYGISAKLVGDVASAGVLTVNVFPDYSPQAYGQRLAEAVGAYDIVASTKPFHPERWTSTYGYGNKCVFVPHGYDKRMHYWPHPPEDSSFDVVLLASWRPEYEELMRKLAQELHGDEVSVAVAGPRWRERWKDAPEDWTILDGIFGRAYGEFVRSGKIVLAPVHRRVVINGRRQPGDEDTTRTYELAAAQTFFLHQRTNYVQTVYDEETEVPMWGSAAELAALVRFYLDREAERHRMAKAAHTRAVPAYSIDTRVNELLHHLTAELDARDS